MALELVNLTTYPKLLRFYRISEMFTGLDRDFKANPQRETITYTYPTQNEQGEWISAQYETTRHLPNALWRLRRSMYQELVAEGHQVTADDFLMDIQKKYTNR